jgi:hypothetical protein
MSAYHRHWPSFFAVHQSMQYIWEIRRVLVTAAALFEVLSLHFVTLNEVLSDSSIVVIEDNRMRIRRLDL